MPGIDERMDVEVRNKLIVDHLPIARRIARQYTGKGVEYDDLFQVASLALVNAANRYDPAKDMRFSSFAIPTIIGEVKHYFRDRLRMIRVSRSNMELLVRIEKVCDNFYQTNQRMPTPAEIAEELSVTTEDVLEAMESSSAAYPVSLNQELTDEGTSTFEEMLGFDENNYERIEYMDFIDRVMNELPELERIIMRRRYFENYTQADVAKELHVSQMYISRVERRILKRFRVAL